MKRTTATIILVALVGGGCAGTGTINKFDTFDSLFREINEKAQNESVSVRLNDGVVLAQQLHLTPDSSSWFDRGTGVIDVVASSRIREIRFSKHRKSRRLGWLTGALSGGALGIASGQALGDDPSCSGGLEALGEFCITAGVKSGILGSIGSVVGALVGRQVDNERSRTRYRYRFGRLKTPF